MARFRKRIAEVEAVQWTGYNWDEMCAFANSPNVMVRAERSPGGTVMVPTLEGAVEAGVGDWIVKDRDGTLSACGGNSFEAAYEPVE